VNQILKSVVREICMLRSVGVGAPIGCPFYPALGVKFPRATRLSNPFDVCDYVFVGVLGIF
jgi:hypothetical protein